MDLQLQLEFTEEWRQVVGYEGFYEVSNLGRVRSVARITLDGRRINGCLLRLRIDRYGYLTASLKKDNKHRVRTIHTLMAEAFIGPRPPGYTVDHKNGKKLDNVIGNLEYATHKEQTNRAIALGLWNPHKANQARKLTEAEVTEIRRLHLEGMSQASLAKQFGVVHQHISRIVNRKRRFSPEGQST